MSDTSKAHDDKSKTDSHTEPERRKKSRYGPFHTLVVIAIAIASAYVVNNFTSTPSKAIGTDNCIKLNHDFRGCEDIARFPNNGPILISCDDRTVYSKYLWSGLSFRQILANSSSGQIFMMNSCKDQTMTRVRIEHSPNSKDFHPHGLGVIVSPKNVMLVYMVNHRSDGEFVEIYEFQPEEHALLWLQEITNEHFIFLNDVEPVIISESSSVLPDFYVSNSFKFEAMTWKNILLEALFIHPRWAKLVHCASVTDTGKWNCDVVDDSLSFGNGVSVSPDQQHLYVVSAQSRSMLIFNISSPTLKKDSQSDRYSIKKWKEVETPSMCDNLYVDEKTGDIFAACQPDVWALRKRMLFSKGSAKSPGNAASSQVVKWDGKQWKEIFRCNGEDPCIEGSSTGLYCKDTSTLLVGTAMDSGVLKCQLPL